LAFFSNFLSSFNLMSILVLMLAFLWALVKGL
jgi:hypothetical protein